jgi:prepilin signal peptidase PulO-like enzyme (type II secretory pathway)
MSYQYPAVEIGTAALFAVAAYAKLSPFDGLYSIAQILNFFIVLAALSVLVVIFVYDLRHKIIPDQFSYGFAALALARLMLFYASSSSFVSVPFAADFLAGPLLALPFVLIWYVSGGKWMGLGDGKLILGIGWFLGLASGISAVCLSFWIGVAVIFAVIGVQKAFGARSGLARGTEIPFAPFLIVGLIIVYFVPMDLFSIHALLPLL